VLAPANQNGPPARWLKAIAALPHGFKPDEVAR